MKEFKVLWTGGWDSTFRIVELSRKKVIIHPIYVIDEGRHSREYELKAMNEIIDVLNGKKETKAKIMPIQIINKSEIPADKKITNAYNTIYAKTNLGAQNEWLARLAKQYPGLELGIVSSSPDVSNMNNTIRQFCKLKFENGIGYIDKEKSSKEGKLVLGNFRFPIIQKTERDMLQKIQEWKYEDVMQHIWFCHHPINGEKCGFCHPCRFKMQSNMEFLLPKESQKRFKLYKTLKRLFGTKIVNKMFYIYRKLKQKNREGV